MKNKRFLNWIVATILMYFASFSHGVSIDILPIDQTVDLGENVSVDIVVSDFSEGQALGDYDFDISFDNSIIELTDVIFGDQLGFSVQDSSSVDAGIVNINELSWETPEVLENNQASSFTLVSLMFSTMSLGTSMVDFDIIWALGDQLGQALSVASSGAQITVIDPGISPVPIPAAFPLLLAGLVGLSFLRRKKL